MSQEPLPNLRGKKRELQRFLTDGLLMLIALLVAAPIAIYIQADIIAPYLFGIGV